MDADIRKQVFDHMRENAIDKEIYIDFINGYYEHVHCLISLGPGQNIDKILMLLKGESSHWINHGYEPQVKPWTQIPLQSSGVLYPPPSAGLFNYQF